MQVRERDVSLADGRTLHAYDTGPGDGLAVCWHHGTPNIGAPPTPLFEAAEHLGVRFFSYDRAGYGGSSALPGRTVGAAASDAAEVADTLGIDRFAVFGHSGGASHALACAVLLPDRVSAAVSVSGPAPFDAEGLDWYAGMADAGVASHRAAERGREAREAFEDAAEELDPGLTEADEEALGGRWAWFLDVVRPALAGDPAAMIDDDLAAVVPWDFDPVDVAVPTLVVHGEADRMVPPSHGRWLADRIPGAELWLRPGDGHLTVLDCGPDALAWLSRKAG